jgi:hypothetical protein
VQASDLRKRLIGHADSGLWVNGVNPLPVSSTALPPAAVRTVLTCTDVLARGRGSRRMWPLRVAGRPIRDAGRTQGIGSGCLGAILPDTSVVGGGVAAGDQGAARPLDHGAAARPRCGRNGPYRKLPEGTLGVRGDGLQGAAVASPGSRTEETVLLASGRGSSGAGVLAGQVLSGLLPFSRVESPVCPLARREQSPTGPHGMTEAVTCRLAMVRLTAGRARRPLGRGPGARGRERRRGRRRWR